jgi:SagB-type dehydrogenase family enzyme
MIHLDSIGKLFGCLKGKYVDGRYWYYYGSSGGLYPVQAYLYVKPNRIKEIAAGIYYYHPLDHRLIQVSIQPWLPIEIYDSLINRPIFDEAAFGIFLIADLSAIMPMYEEQSLHYATIEAGLMTQIIEEAATSCNLGLCQIGELDFREIRSMFRLSESHVLVHSLLGGGQKVT